MKPTRHLSRRKGSGKKGSARARTTKKLRGGVTRKRLSQLTQQELLTALEELPADVVKQIGERHPLLIPPFTNDTLSRAVKDYLAGGARKEDIVKKYGEINNWDVSNVTDMCGLFYHTLGTSFNQPLNNWNVSKVMYIAAARATAGETASTSAAQDHHRVEWKRRQDRPARAAGPRPGVRVGRGRLALPAEARRGPRQEALGVVLTLPS